MTFVIRHFLFHWVEWLCHDFHLPIWWDPWDAAISLMLLKNATVDVFGCEAFTFFLVFSETQEGIFGAKYVSHCPSCLIEERTLGKGICEAKHRLQGQLVPEEGAHSSVGFLIHSGLTADALCTRLGIRTMKREDCWFQEMGGRADHLLPCCSCPGIPAC